MLATHGIVLWRAGFDERAAALVEEAFALAPESPPVLVATGQLALRDDRQAAAQAFTEAIRLGSQSFVPYYLLATQRAGNETPESDERVLWLRRAITLNDRFVPAYHELARLRADEGHTDEAIQLARTAVALDASQVYSWALMGRIALRAQQPDAARLAAESGVEWAIDDRGRELMRTLRAEVDRYETEQPAFEQAREISPGPTVADPPTEPRRLQMSGTWTELRCNVDGLAFVIAADNPPTTLVLTTSAPAPVEIVGADGTVEESITCGPVNHQVEVEFALISIEAGIVRGHLTELSFP